MEASKNMCTRGIRDYVKFDIHSQCVCDRDMTGKIVIITGANSGIGYEAVAAFADKGATVIMACRNKDRAEKALEELMKDNPKRDLSVEIVDVSNLQSVRDFAQRINERYDKIDVLLNNAGLSTNPSLTPEGFEIHFATNHLGHFLLTNLFLDKLKKAKDARIINVSSEAHRFGRYNPDRFKQEINSKVVAYSNSKLCNILFTKELSDRLKGTSVSTFAVHPGLVNTNFPRDYENSIPGRLIMFTMNTIGKPVFKSSNQGAQTLIHAVLNKDLPSQSGSYLSECAVTASSNGSKNTENARELWKLSEKYTAISVAS